MKTKKTDGKSATSYSSKTTFYVTIRRKRCVVLAKSSIVPFSLNLVPGNIAGGSSHRLADMVCNLMLHQSVNTLY